MLDLIKGRDRQDWIFLCRAERNDGSLRSSRRTRNWLGMVARLLSGRYFGASLIGYRFFNSSLKGNMPFSSPPRLKGKRVWRLPPSIHQETFRLINSYSFRIEIEQHGPKKLHRRNFDERSLLPSLSSALTNPISWADSNQCYRLSFWVPLSTLVLCPKLNPSGRGQRY